MYTNSFVFLCSYRSITNFNLILLEDNKQIWSRFQFECWRIEKNKNAFNFLSGCQNNSISNNIQKCYLNLNSESSIIVTSKNSNYIARVCSNNILIIFNVSIRRYR